MSLQDAKDLVLAHYDALAGATPDTVGSILAERTSDDWHWRGMHPFHEQHGAEQVAKVFWSPFLEAMQPLQRRPDIFFAGSNGLEAGGVWVVQMGHLMGLLDKPFLNIPPSRKITMLRYAEFNRVEGGKIVETALFCDLLHLMRQAGVAAFADQTAQHLIQPGPLTHDGLLYGSHDPAEGEATLELIERMIRDISRNSNDGSGRAPYDATPEAELRRCWREDMLWWGPDGIGATYTIPRYIEQHQRPFRTRLSERTFNGHIARIAEGNYGGFFGWANLTLSNTGDYMGVQGNGARADMRVVDLYRREGDQLAENWIFIDMLHFLKMQGVDVLAELS